MRQFTVYAPGCAGAELAAWEKEDFKITTGPEPGPPPETETDVVYWYWDGGENNGGAKWEVVRRLRPKLFVIAAQQKITAVPGDLSAIYERQAIPGEKICFTIGSKLPEKVTAPDWQVVRQGVPLSRTEQVQVLAGAIYRYLLQDVFRETAEWCGHMSSVVGQM